MQTTAISSFGEMPNTYGFPKMSSVFATSFKLEGGLASFQPALSLTFST